MRNGRWDLQIEGSRHSNVGVRVTYIKEKQDFKPSPTTGKTFNKVKRREGKRAVELKKKKKKKRISKSNPRGILKEHQVSAEKQKKRLEKRTEEGNFPYISMIELVGGGWLGKKEGTGKKRDNLWYGGGK